MTDVLPEYGSTAEGLFAARVGDMAYIAVPASDGLRLASAWRLTRPIGQWTQADAWGSEGTVADEAGFRAHVEAVALHLTQRSALARKETRMRQSTPWGMSQGATVYTEGVVFHSTASHGGFKLDAKRNAALPSVLRVSGGWYEEDEEWAKVATGYPHLFTDHENAIAERVLRNSWPDAWEALNGRALLPEESFTRDRQRFERDHARDWVVIAALRSTDRPGFVETIATIGGRRDGSPRRCFLIPSEEYAVGRHGFVIDPGRHQTFADICEPTRVCDPGRLKPLKDG